MIRPRQHRPPTYSPCALGWRSKYEQVTVADLRKVLYGDARSTTHAASLFHQIDALLTPVSAPVES
jgi:hypothetical protein